MSIFIYDDEYTGPRWTYGLILRPPARFNIPEGYIVKSNKPHPSFKLYGTVDYPHALSQEDVTHYDMVLVSGPEVTA